MKVYLHPSPTIRPALRWVFGELARNRGLEWKEVEEASEADIRLDGSRIPLAENFYLDVEAGIFQNSHHFKDQALILDEASQPDLLATAFYMLNCVQEYGASGNDVDQFGRFKYEASWQRRFNLVEENVVQDLFDEVAELLGLPAGNGPGQHPSHVHLSHDVDLLNNGWIQDGKWALRQGQPWKTARYMVQQALGRPHWGNVGAIMDLHQKHGFTSTFFWIPVEGRDGLDGIRNADYRADSPQIQKLMEQVEARGFRNGMHKAASPLSMQEELLQMGRLVSANRNHYLRIRLPEHFDEVEAAGLALDCSLGFAERMGFRTGYGLPFRPYNLKERRPYRFTVQPLHLMDVTLHQYIGLSVDAMLPAMTRFLHRHRVGCTISILWHNNYLLSDGAYAQYRPVYEGVLCWLKEQGWASTSL